jgi:hypothetical protein
LIEHFVKIRRDGKRIEESMDVQAMLAMGWTPDKVVRIEWETDGTKFALDAEQGLLAKVAPDRSAIAVIAETFPDGTANSKLSIINADGSVRYIISNTHTINGEVMTGNFAWFEPPNQDSDHCIGIIFQAESAAGPEQYQFDLNTETGEVVEATVAR